MKNVTLYLVYVIGIPFVIIEALLSNRPVKESLNSYKATLSHIHNFH